MSHNMADRGRKVPTAPGTIGYAGPIQDIEAAKSLLAEPTQRDLQTFLDDTTRSRFICRTVDDTTMVYILRSADGEFCIGLASPDGGASLVKMWGALHRLGVSCTNLTEKRGTSEDEIFAQMVESPI